MKLLLETFARKPVCKRRRTRNLQSQIITMNERPEQLTMEGTTLQQTDVLVAYYQKEAN